MSDLTDVKTIYNGAAGIKTVAVSGTPSATSATDVKTIVDGEAAIKVYNLNGGGSGAVESVNGKTGVVVLDAEDVGGIPQFDELPEAEDKPGLLVQYTGESTGSLVSGYFYKSTAQGTDPETYAWVQTDVQPDDSGSSKTVITLTGESGTLTAEQIAQVLDDTAVLEIVCDGEVFRLSNKDSTLTYRTYINTNCEASETVSFKVIYVQLNSEAVNYGVWTLEEVSAGGSSLPDPTGHSGEFLTNDGTDASWAAVNAMEIIDWEA